MLPSLIHFAAAIASLLLALVSLLPKKPSLAKWWFFAGMVLLGIDSAFTGLSLRAALPSEVLGWLTLGLIVKCAIPAAWLGFSLIYSRGDYRELPKRRLIILFVIALLPLATSLGFQNQLIDEIEETLQLHFSAIGKVLNVLLLVLLVLILMNLEQTFRSAVGTGRWRIKFVVMGLVVIFGARLYVRSQALLYSAYDVNWLGIESSALLIGCAFLVVAYLRTGFAEIDVYPSQTVLRSSLTVLIAGGYLFVVGVLANLVKRFGGVESFQFISLVVLLGLAGLVVLLLSDRLRQRVHGFVSRHFGRAQHDSVRIWTEFSRRLANVKDQAGLAIVSARLISETFEVLSVTVWLLDEQKEQLIAAASTTQQPDEAVIAAGLHVRTSPFDLEEVNEPWAEQLRKINSTRFPNGGNRWCVPLRSGETNAGVLVLADRVNGAAYTFEQVQLLQCIADQITSVLLNLRLANEVARARELEAFRTMSAFFVHDLKNTASSLNMMLKNLPVHFDNPAFREDALRAIGNAARRIDEMIERLSTLRQQPGSKPVEADLNHLVNEAIDRLEQMPQVELIKEFQPVPKMLADREQIQSVVTNLVLNARDALGAGGRIRVSTEHLGGSVVLCVADNGCGMSEAFQKDSLFRPFQTTKKKGLGIGMFQSRMIVEAHGGSIKVESETGKGSTFRISLPVRTSAS
jgi:putative PEP-CTERM system histidine kinase